MNGRIVDDSGTVNRLRAPRSVRAAASHRGVNRAYARRVSVVIALFVLMTLVMRLPATADERVGVNVAVNPAGTATPPNGPMRQLMIGQDVIFKEQVSTEDKGQTQIHFLDESSMSVGPNSDLVIDEFVYDPHADTGKLAMSATRGVFRYVGGKISKLEGGVTVQTPVASIGVRGGAFLLKFTGNRLDIVFVYGKELRVTGRNGQVVTLHRPGYAVTAINGVSSDPYLATQELIDIINAALDGRPGGNGGAKTIPTDQTVVISGIGSDISAQYEANIGAALKQAGYSCQGGGVGGVQVIAGVLTVRCKNGTTNSQLALNLAINSVERGPVTAAKTPTPYSGSLNSVASTATTGYPNSPTSFTGGSVVNGVFSATVDGGTLTLSGLVPGSTASVSGTSPIGTLSGTAFLSPDSSFFYADLTSSGGQVALLQGGLPITSPSASIGSANQVLAFNVQPDPALGSSIPFIRNTTGGSIPGASVSPLYLVSPTGTLAADPTGTNSPRTLQASLAINGTGSNQQSVIVANIGIISSLANGAPSLTGVLRGTAQTSSTASPTLIASGFGSVADGVGGGLYGATGVSGIALASTSPGATETPLNGAPATYNFNQPATAAATPAGVGPGNPSGFIPSSGFFGGLVNYNETGVFPFSGFYAATGTANFTKTGPATFSSTFTSDYLFNYPFSNNSGPLAQFVLNFGGTPSSSPNAVIVDGNIYAATEGTPASLDFEGDPNATSQQLYLLSSGAVGPLGSLLTNGTLCSACQFVQWGYWGGDVNSADNVSGNNRTDLAHLNFWVAGQPTVVMPTVGVGNYRGQMIGAVNNDGTQYTAAGTFSLGYNFGSNNGTFTINNFDRGAITNLSASVSSVGNSKYTGFVSCECSAGGVVNGGFFGPNATETGGNFAISQFNTPYTAAGVFLGHK